MDVKSNRVGAPFRARSEKGTTFSTNIGASLGTVRGKLELSLRDLEMAFPALKGLHNLAQGQPREARRHPGYTDALLGWATLKGLDKKGMVDGPDAAFM